MKIWKASAVGPSVGGAARCNECGVIVQGTVNQNAETTTFFCPNCQKNTMGINYLFCTGDINPLKVEFRDRRFFVVKP